MNHVIYIESMSSSDSSDAESNKGDDGCGLLSADESSDVDGTSIESDALFVGIQVADGL